MISLKYINFLCENRLQLHYFNYRLNLPLWLVAKQLFVMWFLFGLVCFILFLVRFIDICILCLAIYLRSIPHKLPRYIKVPRRNKKPLPKKFDWRDKKVIAEVRNQQTVSPSVTLSWFSNTVQRQFLQVRWKAQRRFWKGPALFWDSLELCHKYGHLNIQ